MFKASIIISVALYLFIFMFQTNPAKEVIVNTVFSQVLALFLINDGSVSSNYDIDMTSINTRMFGIMFEVSLLVASLKISTFMNKPLFIHTSEKL